MKKPLFVLDAFAIIFRSYYAFINNPMRGTDDKNISAVFGFFSTVFKIFSIYKPEYFAVLMDSRTPTFRHEMYKEYKANRAKAPDELFEQVPIIEEICELLNLPIIRADGFEADDLMGTYARICGEEGREIKIISGDKDILQLVNDLVHVLRPEKGGTYTEMDENEILNSWGIRADQIIDYLSLVGDSADNIPGVKGIGAKGAVKLLNDFETLDGLYENIEKITAKAQKKNLIEGKEKAYFSKELVIIKKDCPCEQDIEKLSLGNINYSAVVPVFQRIGLKKMAADAAAKSGTTVPVEEEKNTARSGNYCGVVSVEHLDKWVANVKEAGLFAFDCETDSLDSVSANPVGFSISIKSEEACYIPVRAEGVECIPEDIIREKLRDILEDENIKIIGQNFKYDTKVLKQWGVYPRGLYFDTMIASWMIDSSTPSNMDYLAEFYLNYQTVHFKDIVEKGKTFDTVPIQIAAHYAAEDADITYRLYEVLKNKLKELNMEKIFNEIDVPFIDILSEMELAGIHIDAGELAVYSIELTEKLDALEKEIYYLCGKEFNIKSTKQLQEVLFTDRKLTPGKKTKTGYSTDTTVLQELAKEDPVPAKILAHRTLAKLKSTYVDALPKFINEKTGRIHTHFIQTGTETGRISSKDPNLQNIPVRDENGRRIREAFKASKGHVFVSADYSQIELVVLAHLSGDQELTDAFISGEDVHSRTAALIFQVDPSEVSKEQRRIAKVINFGVMYGMSPFRLSNELNIPRGEASSFIKAYFEKYSGIKEFIDGTIKKAEETNISETLFGRIRHIHLINSRNKMEKKGAERIAVNSRIQGTAADIVKIGMIRLFHALQARGLKAKILLQVHDECILEVPENEVENIKVIVREALEGAAKLSVPLRVSIETAKSWGEIH
ncbi:MAG: DNA polymerase I [Spirochaetaceae bacterium]|jgi:DNA polymerase-1|nr:DNA polymerase I [Spirochaetaceae bacterium]